MEVDGPWDGELPPLASQHIQPATNSSSSNATAAATTPEYITSLNQDGLKLCENGKADEGLELLDHALSVVRGMRRGKEQAALETLTLNNLGFVNKQIGDIDLAVDYFEAALRIGSISKNPSPSTILNLTVVLNAKRSHNRARDLALLAIDIIEAGDFPPTVWVAAYHNLGVAQLHATTKHQPPEVVWGYFDTAIKIATRNFGSTHPMTKSVKESYQSGRRAWELRRQGKSSAARPRPPVLERLTPRHPRVRETRPPDDVHHDDPVTDSLLRVPDHPLQAWGTNDWTSPPCGLQPPPISPPRPAPPPQAATAPRPKAKRHQPQPLASSVPVPPVLLTSADSALPPLPPIQPVRPPRPPREVPPTSHFSQSKTYKMAHDPALAARVAELEEALGQKNTELAKMKQELRRTAKAKTSTSTTPRKTSQAPSPRKPSVPNKPDREPFPRKSPKAPVPTPSPQAPAPTLQPVETVRCPPPVMALPRAPTGFLAAMSDVLTQGGPREALAAVLRLKGVVPPPSAPTEAETVKRLEVPLAARPNPQLWRLLRDAQTDGTHRPCLESLLRMKGFAPWPTLSPHQARLLLQTAASAAGGAHPGLDAVWRSAGPPGEPRSKRLALIQVLEQAMQAKGVAYPHLAALVSLWRDRPTAAAMFPSLRYMMTLQDNPEAVGETCPATCYLLNSIEDSESLCCVVTPRPVTVASTEVASPDTVRPPSHPVKEPLSDLDGNLLTHTGLLLETSGEDLHLFSGLSMLREVTGLEFESHRSPLGPPSTDILLEIPAPARRSLLPTLPRETCRELLRRAAGPGGGHPGLAALWTPRAPHTTGAREASVKPPSPAACRSLIVKSIRTTAPYPGLALLWGMPALRQIPPLSAPTCRTLLETARVAGRPYPGLGKLWNKLWLGELPPLPPDLGRRLLREAGGGRNHAGLAMLWGEVDTPRAQIPRMTQVTNAVAAADEEDIDMATCRILLLEASRNTGRSHPLLTALWGVATDGAVRRVDKAGGANYERKEGDVSQTGSIDVATCRRLLLDVSRRSGRSHPWLALLWGETSAVHQELVSPRSRIPRMAAITNAVAAEDDDEGEELGNHPSEPSPVVDLPTCRRLLLEASRRTGRSHPLLTALWGEMETTAAAARRGGGTQPVATPEGQSPAHEEERLHSDLGIVLASAGGDRLQGLQLLSEMHSGETTSDLGVLLAFSQGQGLRGLELLQEVVAFPTTYNSLVRAGLRGLGLLFMQPHPELSDLEIVARAALSH